jgi:hypothetical protein
MKPMVFLHDDKTRKNLSRKKESSTEEEYAPSLD